MSERSNLIAVDVRLDETGACVACNPPPAVEGMSERERYWMGGCAFLMSAILVSNRPGAAVVLCRAHLKLVGGILQGVRDAHADAVARDANNRARERGALS